MSIAEAPVDARISGISSACKIELLKKEAINVPIKAPTREMINSFSLITLFKLMILLSIIQAPLDQLVDTIPMY